MLSICTSTCIGSVHKGRPNFLRFLEIPPTSDILLPSTTYTMSDFPLKFVFSKKATKIDEIFAVDLTLTTYCQIDGEDFVNFRGLLRKHELYIPTHPKIGRPLWTLP